MKPERTYPPKLPLRFFRWFCHPELRDAIEGDLVELHGERVKELGKRKADWKFAMDVLLLFRPGIIRQMEGYQPVNNMGMYKSYFKIGWRNLLRKKGYSLTSIFGLAVAMTCCLVITFFVLDELSYDQYHVQKDRIYRLATDVEGSTYGGIAKVTGPWGMTAKAEIPEVEEMARFVFTDQTIFERGEKKFYESLGRYTDSSAFKIFSYELLEGNPDKALTAPNAIVLTRTLKEKYFGSEPAVGQSIRLNNEEFNVTGVIQDVPFNSHFSFTYLLSMASLRHPEKDDWMRWNQFYTYLLLKEGALPETVASKMKTILSKHLDAENAKTYTPFLQPLTSIHLYSHLFREMNPNSDVSYIYIFSSIALLILLISCANFINLATAQAATRAKEIGVRKVNGAHRKQLIYQFLTEAFLISFFSLLLAQVLAFSIFPAVNQLTGKNLSLDYLHQPMAFMIVFLVAILTALLAGGYPAFYLSSLKPVQVIKGKWSPTGNSLLRKGLVTFQFTLSSLLVIAAVIIQQQIHFIDSRPLGFDPEQVITIPIQSDYLRTHYETVKKEMEAIPGVLAVSASGNQPGGSDWGIPSLAEGFNSDDMPPMRVMAVDPGFLETFGMELVSGRGFSGESASDSSAYLINEEAARQLAWIDPLGKTIRMPAIERQAGAVIGVVKDFHFRSMREKIDPLLFFMPPAEWHSQYSIKIDATNTQQVLKSIENKWAQLDPEHPFTFSFFDEGYSQLYQQENRLAQIVNYFTVIGVVLACLGLYSLASLTTEQRTKEIGIRKVLGASVGGIAGLLSKDFLQLVVIAFLIASPVAWYLTDRWLRDFAYRIDVEWWMFAVAGLGAVGIALLTVSSQAIKAAIANPVKSLRSE